MIVFMPYPHTRTCESEACEIRDNWAAFEGIDANVVMITTHAVATNRDWGEDNDYPFPILSDYWPHGEVSRAYDTFDETFGYAKRTTYILDSEGVIKDVIASDVLGEARPFFCLIRLPWNRSPSFDHADRVRPPPSEWTRTGPWTDGSSRRVALAMT